MEVLDRMATKKTRTGRKPVGKISTLQPTTAGKFLYGRDWGELPDLMIELKAFQLKLSVADGGLGQAEHFGISFRCCGPRHRENRFCETHGGNA